ncbi:flavin oxidoreductase [Meridianimarinicoccus roseus]|jgi:flavin reductase (DIM6/NTAB) family NADH-FMN oxidoreductase RutF|uniref:Flavin oxidoreductase n=1 Tax=Meridianimarinicoccus roseus TaxID=2072018 RepID=A0A2V2LA25_9RHOB|nr:flavin reductase family protein [Meridianimarinicoccus roseus]PWR02258.1 flavin oxidoreductase [Meridianimarinicoccus roseus]
MDGTQDFEMTSFLPGPGAERQYRDALGLFGTGVTIVTAQGPDGPVAITANSFSSVSLTPALVLWSVDLKSDRCPVFRDASFSAIHVLDEGQADLALHFAKNGRAFDGVDWILSEEGVPLLGGCLARFECETVADHPGGDHRILVSQVLRVTRSDGAPLLFAKGGFGRFARRD